MCPFPDQGMRVKAVATTALSLLEFGSAEDADWKMFWWAALTLVNQSVGSLLLPLFLGFFFFKR